MSNTLPIEQIGAGELTPDIEVLQLHTAYAERPERGEDSRICDDELRLYAAIDGMGLYRGAKEAADLIRDGITQSVEADFGTFTPENGADKMRAAFTRSEQLVKDYAALREGYGLMGAVAAAGHFFQHEGKTYFAYGVVGDAMFVVARKRTDELIKSTEEVWPDGVTVLNCIYGEPSHKAELTQFGVMEIEDGDRVFFLTDGITGDKAKDRLKDDEIWQAAEMEDPQLAADHLLAVSLERKKDDKTAIAAIASLVAEQQTPESAEAEPDATVLTEQAANGGETIDNLIEQFYLTEEGQWNQWYQQWVHHFLGELNASDRDRQRMALHGISKWNDPIHSALSMRELLIYGGIDTNSEHYYHQGDLVKFALNNWMKSLQETARVQAARPELRVGQRVQAWYYPDGGAPYLLPDWTVGPTMPNGNIRLIRDNIWLETPAIDLVRWQRGQF